MIKKYKQEIEELEKEIKEDRENGYMEEYFYSNPDIPDSAKENVERLNNLIVTHYNRNKDEINFFQSILNPKVWKEIIIELEPKELYLYKRLKKIEGFQKYIKEKANKHKIYLEGEKEND
ncbi:MAG: hypothetical protein ACOC56_03305 [Atribacterota bacterium]